jgi:Zn-dependent peptidase ImmA (M78 family)
MRRGFKTEAKKFAIEVRAELGLDEFSPFDPYELAREYGIPVFKLSELGKDPDARCAAAHYTNGRLAKFSAALVPWGEGRFILENDAHSRKRRHNSISHEMSHLLREHPFQEVVLAVDGCRSFSKELEDEADCQAGELLIPHAAALRAAELDWSDDQVAEFYDVSVPLARMRMNLSGARKVIANKRSFRQRIAQGWSARSDRQG